MIRKYKTILSLALIFVNLGIYHPLTASTVTSLMLHDHVEYRKIQVDSPEGAVNVHMILVDRSAIEDGELILEPATGGSHAGQTASVQSIAVRNGALACINGPYFASSGSRVYPLGFAVLHRRLFNTGNLQRPLVGMDSDGTLSIEVGHPRAFVTSEAYFDPVWLWGVNTVAGEDDVTMYDSFWEPDVDSQDGVAVAVAPIQTFVSENSDIEISDRTRRAELWDGEVIEVSRSGSVSVPDDGFVLVFRGQSMALAENYDVGEGVSIYVYELPRHFESLEWITTLGPWFVKNGHFNNYDSETPYSGNITGSSERSMIGTTWNDEIFFAKTTGAPLTPRQAADVMSECNVRDAVMCDSGSSSGLWAERIGITGSSREIPMGFIVREANESDNRECDPLNVWEGRLLD